VERVAGNTAAYISSNIENFSIKTMKFLEKRRAERRRENFCKLNKMNSPLWLVVTWVVKE